MNPTSQQVEIQWPITALFNYVSDITNNAEWQQGVIRSEWTHRTLGNVGSTFFEIHKIEDREFLAEGEVVEFVPNEKRIVKLADKESRLCSMSFVAVSQEQTRLIVQVNGEGQPDVFFDLPRLKEILELNN
jgi:hypothetical protein